MIPSGDIDAHIILQSACTRGDTSNTQQKVVLLLLMVFPMQKNLKQWFIPSRDIYGQRSCKHNLKVIMLNHPDAQGQIKNRK